jgi:hypothetical protein
MVTMPSSHVVNNSYRLTDLIAYLSLFVQFDAMFVGSRPFRVGAGFLVIGIDVSKIMH